MAALKRRTALLWGCVQCAGLAGLPAGASASPWSAPARFQRPDVSTDEGGLWALMDREESRLRRSPFRVRDEGLTNYIREIACRLGREHCADLRCYLVRAPFFNASMAPNGMMQVWSGLILRMENEAQLAAVIGHEIAHYLQRHSVERMRDQQARAAFGQVLGLFGVVGLVGQLATLAGAMAYSRSHELDADKIGLVLMQQAGYDTRAAAQVWSNLLAELRANPDLDPAKNSVLFATHPPSDERQKMLSSMAVADKSGELGEQRFIEKTAGFKLQMLEDEIKRGQHSESIVLITRLLNSNPDDPPLLHYKGEAHRLRNADGDREVALTDLSAAVTKANPLPISHRSLGFLHRSMGQPEKAREHFKLYLEMAPDAVDAEMIRRET